MKILALVDCNSITIAILINAVLEPIGSLSTCSDSFLRIDSHVPSNVWVVVVDASVHDTDPDISAAGVACCPGLRHVDMEHVPLFCIVGVI